MSERVEITPREIYDAVMRLEDRVIVIEQNTSSIAQLSAKVNDIEKTQSGFKIQIGVLWTMFLAVAAAVATWVVSAVKGGI